MEKFRSEAIEDYRAREAQKDFGFKTRYFEPDAIGRKAETVLKTMHDSEVTLAQMAQAVYAHLKYCVVTWHSGNFYGLAASNSLENLSRYLSLMAQPAIPQEYAYPPGPFTELARWK